MTIAALRYRGGVYYYYYYYYYYYKCQDLSDAITTVAGAFYIVYQ